VRRRTEKSLVTLTRTRDAGRAPFEAATHSPAPHPLGREAVCAPTRANPLPATPLATSSPVSLVVRRTPSLGSRHAQGGAMQTPIEK
jgi:hypothetical protein